MDINQAIANWQNEHLSAFCINECGGFCCRLPHTKIRVTKKQIEEMLKTNPDPNFTIKAKRDWDNEDSYFIITWQDHRHPHCPAFCPENKKCKIQHAKPEMCLTFPIIIDNQKEEIILHRRCQLTTKPEAILEELKNICLKYNYSLYIE